MRKLLVLFITFSFCLCVLGCKKDEVVSWTYNPVVDLRSFEGTTLHVIAAKHPWVDLVSDRINFFTAATGIHVSFEIYPEEQFRTKRMVEMVSGISKADLFMITPGNSLNAYVNAGWVEDLSQYLWNRSLAWPQFNFLDFYLSALMAGCRNGNYYSLPVMLETSLLSYNKELFDKYNLTPPQTMDELETTASQIYQQSNGEIYGITMRGKRSPSTSQWIDFVHSFGGDWLDKNGRFALDSPKVLDATKFYGDLLRNYGPPSAPSNGLYESTRIFMEGRAAMIYDANVFSSQYEDEERSRVAGKVGYTLIPAGEAGRVPHSSYWGLSIYRDSLNKEAAWYFIQWALSADNAVAGLLKGIPSARKSVWEDPVIELSGLSEEWISASMDSYNRASSFWNPPVIDVAQGREIVGEVITSAILGDKYEDAAIWASNQLNSLKEKEGRVAE